jgi:hypothetical protein
MDAKVRVDKRLYSTDSWGLHRLFLAAHGFNLKHPFYSTPPFLNLSPSPSWNGSVVAIL